MRAAMLNANARPIASITAPTPAVSPSVCHNGAVIEATGRPAATVHPVDDDLVTIGFIDDVQESLVRTKLAAIEAAIADVVGVPLRVKLRSTPVAARGRTPGAAKSAPDGESDLLAYARHKLMSASNEAETS